jgi:serine/threonine protein kinase
MVRHYTAFAEFGDLESLYDNHAGLSNAVDEHGVALSPPPIPIVAIMYMFQAMAAGACLMAHGAVPDDQGRWPGNQPPHWPHDIIHRDIKPRNYFISSSESSVLWPKLPIAALGDFGNAFDAVSLMGAGGSHRMGTERYMAPEQLPNYRTIFTVTPATNVYQIGVAILQLMHLQLPRLQADFDTEDQGPVFPGFPVDATFYPQALIDLAEDCVQPVPRDRPTPVTLYLQIRDLASGYPDESNKEIPWRKYQQGGEAIRSFYADIISMLELQTVPPNQRVRNNIDRWAV